MKEKKTSLTKLCYNFVNTNSEHFIYKNDKFIYKIINNKLIQINNKNDHVIILGVKTNEYILINKIKYVDNSINIAIHNIIKNIIKYIDSNIDIFMTYSYDSLLNNNNLTTRMLLEETLLVMMSEILDNKNWYFEAILNNKYSHCYYYDILYTKINESENSNKYILNNAIACEAMFDKYRLRYLLECEEDNINITTFKHTISVYKYKGFNKKYIGLIELNINYKFPLINYTRGFINYLSYSQNILANAVMFYNKYCYNITDIPRKECIEKYNDVSFRYKRKSEYELELKSYKNMSKRINDRNIKLIKNLLNTLNEYNITIDEFINNNKKKLNIINIISEKYKNIYCDYLNNNKTHRVGDKFVNYGTDYIKINVISYLKKLYDKNTNTILWNINIK